MTFTRSVEHAGPEKFSSKATCVKAFFFPENPWNQPDAKELNILVLTIFNYFTILLLVLTQYDFVDKILLLFAY